MKKSLLLASCCLFALNGFAQGSVSTMSDSNLDLVAVKAEAAVEAVPGLEIKPFAIKAGEEKTVSMFLNDCGVKFRSIQFDIFLPEGLTIKTTTDRGGKEKLSIAKGDRLTETHAVVAAAHEPGHYRVLIPSNNAEDVYDVTEGYVNDIAKISFVAAKDFAGGVADVVLKDVKLGSFVPVAKEYFSPDATSSVVLGAPAESAVALKGNFDEASLAEFSAALGENVTSVDFTAATVPAGAKFATANPNALVYVAEGQSLANEANVVVADQCANLVLTDGADFAPVADFNAAKASFTRTVEAEGWYTVCLPFAANVPEGVDVEKFVAFDAANEVVRFDAATAMESGAAYLFKGVGATTFAAENVAVSNAVVDGEFVGTFANVKEGLEGKHALKADGTGFGICTATASVPAFRAYLNVPSSAKTLALGHGDVTGIEGVDTQVVAGDVYTVGGQLVKKNATNLNGLAKGVYVVNGKKIVK